MRDIRIKYSITQQKEVNKISFIYIRRIYLLRRNPRLLIKNSLILNI